MPRPFEVAARAFELAPKLLLKPYLDALGLEIDDQTGEFTEKPGEGLMLTGYSRTGMVRRSKYPDFEARVRVVEKLADRFYGKARQAVDLAGNAGVTNVVVIPQTAERAFTVAQVLMEAGAISTESELADFEGTAEEIDDE